MPPYMLSQLAIARGGQLRAAGGRARPHVSLPRPRNSVRHRVGWTLVEVGLRLAGVPDDA
jgi:hypothetical protein